MSRKPVERVVKDIKPDGTIVVMTRREERLWRKRMKKTKISDKRAAAKEGQS
jgi:hypothetical protein